MKRRVGYPLAWLLTVVVATVVGLVAVSTVGASVRGRGPLGNEVVRDIGTLEESGVTETRSPSAVREVVEGPWGTFEVECRGVDAYGLDATPARAEGWRVVSYEQGPDDDVDAVLSNGRQSVELEVFCNRGRPTVAEEEYNTLPDDD